MVRMIHTFCKAQLHARRLLTCPSFAKKCMAVILMPILAVSKQDSDSGPESLVVDQFQGRTVSLPLNHQSVPTLPNKTVQYFAPIEVGYCPSRAQECAYPPIHVFVGIIPSGKGGKVLSASYIPSYPVQP